MNRFQRRFTAMLFAGAVGWPAMAGALFPTGTLRATFLGGNPVQGSVDPQTGSVSGPAVDLVHELARRLGVPFTVTALPSVRAVIDSVKTGAADIGFVAFDPERAVEVDFSQAYSLAYNTYLVSVRSPIRTVADVDRSGVRIGVGNGDAADLFLSRTLKHAELKRNLIGTMAEAERMLTASEVDAYAANRQRLFETAAHTPDMRVLPDNFLAVEQAIIVAKGDASRRDIVNRFIDDMRASGFIRAALDRANLKGVDVAPPQTK
jgi:polar amino acid transport system substrate-binding protein